VARKTAPSPARDVVTFFDRYIQQNELGQPFTLQPHQRIVLAEAFRFDAEGRLPYDTILYSCVKKSGKTTINAGVTLWWAFTQEAPNEILIIANDLEQAQARVFKTMRGLLRYNPALTHSADPQNRVITLTNDTTLAAIASEYAGAAGSNHGFTSWDELWGYTSESSHRLYEELTPVPTRHNSIRFITTYAGFEGESDLLWNLFKLVVSEDEHPDGQGVRLHPTLPIYANAEARIFAYWDHEPRMPWQTPTYYTAQRRTLRASQFLRLHENRWTTAASTFITPELWDQNVHTDHRPRISLHGDLELFVGVDAGIKHDTAAVVAVYWDGDALALASHRIWKPTPEDPLDIEATIETYLRELASGGTVRAILCDPYQLHRSITTLKAAGLPIREYPQTTGNTTAMGQGLFDLLNGRNLLLYPSDELRGQALNTVAIESSRGWRIAKEKSSKKIDAIVALAMACRGATDIGRLPELIFA
jgi:phage terminase large subunit-like protein